MRKLTGHRILVAALCLCAVEGLSEVLISDDFDSGQVVGNKPLGATVVRPTEPAGDISTLVVDGDTNIAGAGNGVRLLDDNISDGVRLEYDMVAGAAAQLSVVRVDFSFAALSTTNSGDYLKISVGQFGVSQTSSSLRFLDCRLFADGTIDFVSGSGPDSYNNALLVTGNTLSIFVNDLDTETITYTGPDSNVHVLQSNAAAYWLNGSLKLETMLENRTTAQGTVFNSTNNIGRFSIASLTSDFGLDFVIDDLVLSSLIDGPPEPTARLHTVFQDHMVLQRDMDVPVWGKATEGTELELLLDDLPAGSAVADATGDWMVRMPPRAHDGGVSHVLKLMVSNEVQQVISDIIFGDVFLCSGQSNMEFLMSDISGFTEAYATESNPYIRHIAIERGVSVTPIYEPAYEQPWSTTSPGSIGNFTAVGYMFAKEIHARTGVPVGLLNSSYGGQRIKRFVDFGGLEAVPELAGYLANAERGGVSEVAYIYNAQIAPLSPFGICGILWYQGETDRLDAIMYEELMYALMRGWRSVWGQEALPFYYCQLPHYNTPGYTVIRDGQLRALSEPNCGMAVTIDVGDDSNIHPTDKQDPGYRLAQWALARKYGFSKVYSGPIYLETRQEGAQIRVLFDYAEGGLMIGRKDGTNAVEEVAGGPLECFEVAGANRQFVVANAVIDADTVLVSAPSVPSPQYVRYCYSNPANGTNRLYNAAGLPAAAFRSDESYELVVASGTGSADPVIPDTLIPVSAAAAPSGKVFDRWIGGGSAIADAGSASTSITMPDRDLYILATYRDSAGPTYTLTVNSGAGDGTAKAGSIMDLMADPAPPGQVFNSWTGDTQAVVRITSEFTTMRMPASNVTVTATYRTADAPPAPIIGVSDLDVSSNQVSMSLLTAEEGYRYELDSCTNLIETEWETAIFNIRGDGQDKQLRIPSPGEGTAFYRLNLK